MVSVAICTHRLIHFWARNNFKTAEDRAVGFAYSFLGVRIQCAQCHKHPFDQWSKDDFDNFERLFEGVQANANSLSADARPEFRQLLDELQVDKDLKGNTLRKELGQLLKQGNAIPFPELTVRATSGKRKQRPNANVKAKNRLEAAAPPQAKLLGGEWIALDQPDVRQQLMDWLRAPDNPYFAQAIVNRVWAQYFGVGIVNPPDDLNLANAPSNAPLLDYLSSGFIEHGYDLKWLHREIANSDAYQRSWVVNDAAVQGWLSDPQTSWSAQVADKFGWKRSDSQRSVDVSRRLAAARRAGRTKQALALEAQLMQQKQRSQASAAMASATAMTGPQARWIAEQAYLRTLSRQPQQQELGTAIRYLRAGLDPVVAVQELMWGLINTKEFILNH